MMESRDGLGGTGALELPQSAATSRDIFTRSGCSEPRPAGPGVPPQPARFPEVGT